MMQSSRVSHTNPLCDVEDDRPQTLTLYNIHLSPPPPPPNRYTLVVDRIYYPPQKNRQSRIEMGKKERGYLGKSTSKDNSYQNRLECPKKTKSLGPIAIQSINSLCHYCIDPAHTYTQNSKRSHQ